jgi:glutathione S-transferase
VSDIFLHHYPESPFSEKIRLILGYKGLSYQSVTIPVIMPKPDLMPLTGGYRKTPVMQIGADIYCDTEIISRVIDHLHPENSLYPKGEEASAGTMAQWSDTILFSLAVSVVFQPKAMAANAIFQDPERAAAFAADRAELVKGGAQISMPFEVANPQFLAHIRRLDNQLADGRNFLLGSVPSIADFSTYHCIWFIHNNEAIRDIFDPFDNLSSWRVRMEAFGQGQPVESSGEEALAIAESSEPVTAEKQGGLGPDDIAIGEKVEVMPTDYGLNPVTGTLLVSSLEEIAVARNDKALGNLVVHFPRMGFQVGKPA